MGAGGAAIPGARASRWLGRRADRDLSWDECAARLRRRFQIVIPRRRGPKDVAVVLLRSTPFALRAQSFRLPASDFSLLVHCAEGANGEAGPKGEPRSGE